MWAVEPLLDLIPSAPMRARASYLQVGDGTTSVVVLAGELLREAELLVNQKIHPMVIIAGAERSMGARQADVWGVAGRSVGRGRLLLLMYTCLVGMQLVSQRDHPGHHGEQAMGCHAPAAALLQRARSCLLYAAPRWRLHVWRCLLPARCCPCWWLHVRCCPLPAPMPAAGCPGAASRDKRACSLTPDLRECGAGSAHAPVFN